MTVRDLITPDASTAPTHYESIISTGNNHAIFEDSVVVTEVRWFFEKPKEALRPDGRMLYLLQYPRPLRTIASARQGITSVAMKAFNDPPYGTFIIWFFI